MQELHYFGGIWSEEPQKVMTPATQAVWMATAVFDGTRVIRGMGPDVDRHCQRCVNSAHALGLEPPLDAKGIEALIWEGVDRFPADAELFIRPMFYPERGFVMPEPDSTVFALALLNRPLMEPTGITAMLSRFHRPALDMAPTNAKAACLYPNAIRAMREAQAAGFSTAVMMDGMGHVAEFATSNIFHVRDGMVHTPVPNGTFLNGITRQRVIRLLREAGVEVLERPIVYDEVLEADEVFSTGNLDKVVPVTRLDGRDYQRGPLYQKAREIYFDWAKTQTRKV
ncbi:MAG: branched-chain amino acid aminotransferase [Proteobacteria bacterium]|nr:branched-chain amino acid aminotransferase [Pseudomonadota bacterium]